MTVVPRLFTPTVAAVVAAPVAAELLPLRARLAKTLLLALMPLLLVLLLLLLLLLARIAFARASGLARPILRMLHRAILILALLIVAAWTTAAASALACYGSAPVRSRRGPRLAPVTHRRFVSRCSRLAFGLTPGPKHGLSPAAGGMAARSIATHAVRFFDALCAFFQRTLRALRGAYHARMSAVVITPPVKLLDLHLQVPLSKSHALRALVLAAQCESAELEVGASLPTDVTVLLRALTALGAQMQQHGDILRVVRPVDRAATAPVSLDAGEGGAPARFLLALAAGLRRPVTISGCGRLPTRPFAPLVKALRTLGAHVDGDDGLPLTVCGPASGGAVRLDASASSQFVSALLLAAPLYPHGVAIEIIGTLNSQPYVQLTRSVLAEFGIAMHDAAAPELARDSLLAAPPTHWCPSDGARFSLGPMQRCARTECWRGEGDWSGAAVLFAAAALTGGRVRVDGLRLDSEQPDAAVAGILRGLGCTLESGPTWVAVSGIAQCGLELDLRHTPDLAPPLVALAAYRPFVSRFTGLGALRHKESDRIAGLQGLLTAVGVPCTVDGDSMTVRGVAASSASALVPDLRVQGDHRLAMAAALLGLARKVRIDDAKCVAKSFPNFFGQWPGAHS